MTSPLKRWMLPITLFCAIGIADALGPDSDSLTVLGRVKLAQGRLDVISHQVVHTGHQSDAMSCRRHHGIARSPAWTSIRMHD